MAGSRCRAMNLDVTFGAKATRITGQKDGPHGEETPNGPDAKPTRSNRMEDDA